MQKTSEAAATSSVGGGDGPASPGRVGGGMGASTRFEINLEAAEHAKLKVSSRLLALAKTVIGGHRGT